MWSSGQLAFAVVFPAVPHQKLKNTKTLKPKPSRASLELSLRYNVHYLLALEPSLGPKPLAKVKPQVTFALFPGAVGKESEPAGAPRLD